MSDRVQLLRDAARKLAGDLERASFGRWSCHLTTDLQLQLIEDERVVGQEPVPAEFDPDNWPDEALDAKWIDVTEADDATEAIGDVGAELSRSLGTFWPDCPEHSGELLMVCSSVWTCRTHDVSPLGELELPSRSR